jgi:Secretion system C-terminal sorting domain
MKLFYAFFLSIFVSSAFAQVCNPADHDWGTAAFGVSPDPTIGENFVSGVINLPYSDQVYVKAPASVADVDSTFVGIELDIDSISLDSITYFNGLSDLNLSSLGLNVTCNNNGDSPNQCMFLPGNAYCGDIAGIPNAVGSFPVKIHVTVYFYFFTNQAIEYTFDGYTLDILQEIAVIEANVDQALGTLQNYPNPVNVSTTIKYDIAKAETAHIVITNLMGKKVYDKSVNSKRGDNAVVVNTEDFAAGIYLYSVAVGDKKITKRMLIQH